MGDAVCMLACVEFRGVHMMLLGWCFPFNILVAICALHMMYECAVNVCLRVSQRFGLRVEWSVVRVCTDRDMCGAALVGAACMKRACVTLCAVHAVWCTVTSWPQILLLGCVCVFPHFGV